MTSRRITDRQRAVIDTMRMHLRPKQALKYLEDSGHPMAESTWYGWKRFLNKTMQERLYEVAQYEFPEQHLESIEEIKIARKEMWTNYRAEKDPLKKATILEKIINTRPLLSSYYDSTKGVIEKPEQESIRETTIQESESVPDIE